MPVGQFKLKWPPHWKRECRRWMAVTASVGASAATGSVMLVAYHASGNFNLKLDGTPSLSQLATLPLWQWRWPHCHCGSGAGHTATGTGSATPGTGAADTRVGCCHCVPLAVRSRCQSPGRGGVAYIATRRTSSTTAATVAQDPACHWQCTVTRTATGSLSALPVAGRPAAASGSSWQGLPVALARRWAPALPACQ